MIKLEVLEKFSIEGQVYHAGEIRVVPEVVAKTACGAGWARDVDGVIPTGERDPSAKKLEVGKLSHPAGVTKAGG
jgi:hypothetical protein